MSLAPRKPGFYIPLRKHISPDCKRDILFRRGTQIRAGDSLGAACYKRLIPAAKAKAVNHTRDIPQTFWRDDRLPWLELRSYGAAAGPISATATPALGGGDYRGETRCLCAGRVPAATRDLIVIRRTRRIAVIRCMAGRAAITCFTDATWCHAQRPDIPRHQYHLAAAAAADSPLFASFQQVVALMCAGALNNCPPGWRYSCTRCRCAPPRRRRHITPAPCCFSAAMDLPASPSLDKLAHDSALRKETVIRAVKQDTGLTPASLINMARIEYAKTRLRAGAPIADVGYQAGFADQSHFHKTFVSYTAATRGSMRKADQYLTISNTPRRRVASAPLSRPLCIPYRRSFPPPSRR